MYKKTNPEDLKQLTIKESIEEHHAMDVRWNAQLSTILEATLLKKDKDFSLSFKYQLQPGSSAPTLSYMEQILFLYNVLHETILHLGINAEVTKERNKHEEIRHDVRTTDAN